MIVPIAFQFSKDYAAARRNILASSLALRELVFAQSVGALHPGLGVRSTIVLGSRAEATDCHVTEMRRWTESFARTSSTEPAMPGPLGWCPAMAACRECRSF